MAVVVYGHCLMTSPSTSMAFPSHVTVTGEDRWIIPPTEQFKNNSYGGQLVHTSSILLGPQWLIELRWLWTDELSPTSCMWVHFPNGCPYYAWTAQSVHSDLVGSRAHACLAVTCTAHMAEWPASFTCHSGNIGTGGVEQRLREWNEYRQESQHRILHSGGKKSPAAPIGDRIRDVPMTSPASYHWPIYPHHPPQVV